MSVDLNVPYFVVDAFTKSPFKGNPAGVCLLPDDKTLSREVKQKLAAEFQHSETAFVTLTKATDTFYDADRFHLEYFTPTCEVKLCGHATLASSSVLFSVCKNPSAVLTFETLSGILTASKLPDGRIEINLPAYEAKPVDKLYEKVIKATVGSLPVKDILLTDTLKLLIRLHDDVKRKDFEKFRPSEAELLSASSDINGVIITLKGSEEDVDEEGNRYDFLSRYFAPWMGILEDPVTGSAHSVLAPYWAKVLKTDYLYGRQCSERGGELRMTLRKDRVSITGNAVLIVKGQIYL